jgi:hypothetical protein
MTSKIKCIAIATDSILDEIERKKRFYKSFHGVIGIKQKHPATT